VLSVPHGSCASLKRGWSDAFARLSQAVAADPSVVREQWRWLIEQISLGCGILLEDLAWHPLPPAMNFPTHMRVISESVPNQPVILHYHQDHDERGYLYRSRTREMDPFLDRFNLWRAEATGEAYGGIRRRPLPQRVRRSAATWFWGLLADRAWYRSASMTRLRRQVKHVLASR
jgi:hypothetical protein